MNLETKLNQLHADVKNNQWFHYFAVFNRIALAAGFIPSGLTKVLGERFTSLSVSHPMGNYLEAFYHTGIYYPFIGYVQVLAALLLLIPKTATLGAILYFPVILNICVLSLAVGFDGSLISSPLMVLANVYLLCWDYDKLKFILSLKQQEVVNLPIKQREKRFPIRFFISVIFTIAATVLIVTNLHVKKSRNTLEDCNEDCRRNNSGVVCFDFCDCIHKQGRPLSECAYEMRKAEEK